MVNVVFHGVPEGEYAIKACDVNANGSWTPIGWASPGSPMPSAMMPGARSGPPGRDQGEGGGRAGTATGPASAPGAGARLADHLGDDRIALGQVALVGVRPGQPIVHHPHPNGPSGRGISSQPSRTPWSPPLLAVT